MWLRVDFTDNTESFLIETDLDESAFGEHIRKKLLISVKRQLILKIDQKEGEKPQFNFVPLNFAHPLYNVCSSETINSNFIKSFGVVDETSPLWQVVSEKVLNENKIITPNKKIIGID